MATIRKKLRNVAKIENRKLDYFATLYFLKQKKYLVNTKTICKYINSCSIKQYKFCCFTTSRRMFNICSKVKPS